MEYDTDEEKNERNEKRTSKSMSESSGSKRSKRPQKYKPEWESEFKWVKKSRIGEYNFACIYCAKDDLTCENDGKTALKRHEKAEKHKKSARSVATSGNIFQICKKSDDDATRAKKIELQATMFIIKKDLPIAVCDDLIDLIKNMDIDTNVQKKLACKRTKCSAIIKNVIGAHCFDNLVNILRKTKFSLIIDDSTDLSTQKNLVLCVRFTDCDNKVHDEFLAILELHDGKASGHYDAITEFFEVAEIPFKENMVGFASDGASVMFGKNNSVAAYFQRDIPHLFTMKCICHSLNLAVSRAVKAIPPEIEETISNAYNYVKGSAKRQQKLCDIQKIWDVPEHKILKIMKIRWLSLGSAVSRFLEQYDTLYLFFEEESKQNTEEGKKARPILQRLQNRWTILYLKFLNYILPIVNKRNLQFQAESPKIHVLHKQMEDLFKTIVSMYLKEDSVEKKDPEFVQFESITKENESDWEPLRNIDLGPAVKADLHAMSASLSVTEIDKFRNICRNVLISLAQGIYMRFPFKEPSIMLLKELGFMDPLQLRQLKEIAVAAQFFGFDIENVHREFKTLKRMTKDMNESCPTKFWSRVEQMKEFPLILAIVARVTVLPHSSANCERIFSQINLNKTKLRNMLENETLTGILHGKSLIKKHQRITDIDCTEMLKKMDSRIYE